MIAADDHPRPIGPKQVGPVDDLRLADALEHTIGSSGPKVACTAEIIRAFALWSSCTSSGLSVSTRPSAPHAKYMTSARPARGNTQHRRTQFGSSSLHSDISTTVSTLRASAALPNRASRP